MDKRILDIIEAHTDKVAFANIKLELAELTASVPVDGDLREVVENATAILYREGKLPACNHLEGYVEAFLAINALLPARTPETDTDVGSIDDALRLFRDEQISMGRMMEIAHAWRGGKSFTLPESGPETGTDVVKHMVDRFLCWRLPKPWNPDGGISYQRPNYAHPPADHDWPVGTNLFDADQATAMVHFMLEGLPANLLRAPAVDAGAKEDLAYYDSKFPPMSKS